MGCGCTRDSDYADWRPRQRVLAGVTQRPLAPGGRDFSKLFVRTADGTGGFTTAVERGDD